MYTFISIALSTLSGVLMAESSPSTTAVYILGTGHSGDARLVRYIDGRTEWEQNAGRLAIMGRGASRVAVLGFDTSGKASLALYQGCSGELLKSHTFPDKALTTRLPILRTQREAVEGRFSALGYMHLWFDEEEKTLYYEKGDYELTFDRVGFIDLDSMEVGDIHLPHRSSTRWMKSAHGYRLAPASRIHVDREGQVSSLHPTAREWRRISGIRLSECVEDNRRPCYYAQGLGVFVEMEENVWEWITDTDMKRFESPRHFEIDAFQHGYFQSGTRFEGHPATIVYAQMPAPDREWPATLVIYDPQENRELWKKQFAFPVPISFWVAKDASWIMLPTKSGIHAYHRRRDRIAYSIDVSDNLDLQYPYVYAPFVCQEDRSSKYE